MTESKWLTCTKPRAMLDFLQARASDRKLRLFACACCRRIWHQLQADRDACACVERVERYIDGLADKGDFDAVVDELLRNWNLDDPKAEVTGNTTTEEGAKSLADTIFAGTMTLAAYRTGETAYRIENRTLVTARPAIIQAVKEAAKYAAMTVGLVTRRANNILPWQSAEKEAVRAEYTGQCQLVRDIVGNPFHPVVINPAWLTGNSDTVRRIAQAIYDNRAFDRLPILADALEDAGCDNADILAHCRGPGPHVRGCWVVDLLLGKS